VAGEPIVTFPKLALAGVIVSAGCMPLPDTVTTAVEPCELDTVMLPVMFSDADGLKTTLIAALWPAPMVSPAAMPLAEKSLAFTVTAEIVALAVPLLVTVTVWVLELPTAMPGKLKLVGLAVSEGAAAVPVPLSGTAVGELVALLAILTLPVRLPAVVGSNRTLNVVVPPAGIVAGVASPLTLKAPPLSPICEIVSDAVPVFVTVKLSDFVCPSATLPKLKLDGETDNPASAMLSDGFDALLAMVIDPDVLPDAVGVNVTLSVILEDAFTVTGAVAPVTANTVPFRAMAVMFTAAVPVLLTTICWAALVLPTATLPRFRLAGDADSWPTAVF
jgi:hypothetical protein